MNRNLRLLILLALIIVVAARAFVFLSGDGNNTPAATPPVVDNGQQNLPQATDAPPPTLEPTAQLTDIVIAIQDISRGSIIPPNAIRLQPWPLLAAPFNAVTSVEDVIGKRARTDIFVEQPILTSMVVDDLSNLASVGSDASAIIPRGLVLVAVPMDRLTSVAYALQPGDRVDIIVSFLFVDIDEQFQSILPNTINLISIAEDPDTGDLVLSTDGVDVGGRFETISISGINWPVVQRPREEPRPRLLTQRTIQDALVIHVGNFPLDGKLFGDVATPTVEVPEEQTSTRQQAANEIPTPLPTAQPLPDIVSLAVTPQDAVIITWLIEARIPITFALRSASDTSRVPTDPVTLDYIMSEYGIAVPEKREFSIQPAIRSIRQLIGGETIEISNGS
jgi:pilus assembly protein CpaB